MFDEALRRPDPVVLGERLAGRGVDPLDVGAVAPTSSRHSTREKLTRQWSPARGGQRRPARTRRAPPRGSRSRRSSRGRVSRGSFSVPSSVTARLESLRCPRRRSAACRRRGRACEQEEVPLGPERVDLELVVLVGVAVGIDEDLEVVVVVDRPSPARSAWPRRAAPPARRRRRSSSSSQSIFARVSKRGVGPAAPICRRRPCSRARDATRPRRASVDDDVTVEARAEPRLRLPGDGRFRERRPRRDPRVPGVVTPAATSGQDQRREEEQGVELDATFHDTGCPRSLPRGASYPVAARSPAPLPPPRNGAVRGLLPSRPRAAPLYWRPVDHGDRAVGRAFGRQGVRSAGRSAAGRSAAGRSPAPERQCTR